MYLRHVPINVTGDRVIRDWNSFQWVVCHYKTVIQAAVLRFIVCGLRLGNSSNNMLI